MKFLAAILVVCLFAVATYLFINQGDKPGGMGDGLSEGGMDQHSALLKDLPKGITVAQLTFVEDMPAMGSLAEIDLAKIDRTGWGVYRNPMERKVPDPDRIGACPPPQLGGHPALVVRRFLDHETGDRVWMHEDGSMTVHHYERTKDPGRKEEIGRWVISTAVPTPHTGRDPSSGR